MKFNLIDHTGHTEKSFDKNDAAAMAKAEMLFNEIQKSGSRLAVTPAPPGDAIAKKFDPNADEYTTVRPIQGG